MFTDNQKGRQTPVALAVFSPLWFRNFPFPGLIPPFCSLHSHSCSLFASHLSCPCHYSLSLSLERGLDDFLFLSVSVRSLPHHVTPPCLTSLTLSFHQYTQPCNLNISESISLSLMKNQFGLETLYFSWCNKKENLMGVDLSAASPPGDIIYNCIFFGCITWTRQMCMCLHNGPFDLFPKVNATIWFLFEAAAIFI